MDHQAAVKTNQPGKNQSACCAKPDVNLPDSSHMFRELHQRIGNRAFGRLVQAKLNISEPGDEHEREADRVADQVMRMPSLPVAETASVKPAAPQVQRKCGACAEEELKRKAHEEKEEQEEEEEPVPRKALASDANPTNPSKVESGINNISGGQPLSASARAFFEPRFGYDFSGVRVHTDSWAAGSATSINAVAYTKGSDIVFGEGHYSPESSAGQKLLAHELTHVVQQASGAVQRQTVQRRVRVGPDAAARTEMLGVFNFLCPTGGFRVVGNTIRSNCANATGPSCECLCDATSDRTRNYSIDVQVAARNDRQETLHDGSIATISDTTVGPTTSGGDNPDVVMTRSSSAMEFAVFAPNCTPIWLPNWRILGHELCGHGRLRQSYPGEEKGNRPAHDPTIDTENTIAAEHGEPARGHFADPRQGESATNPVGDRSLLVFKLLDGWHFESPRACVAPAAPAPVPGPRPPATPAAPAFRWTASALGGLEATELQGLFGLGASVLPLRNGPLLVYNPIIGLNVVYSPSTELQPQEFMLVMADIGLRIQQPVTGAYFDATGGAFLGFEAQVPGAEREFTGGLGLGVGAGWRWERIEIGAEARTLFPLTQNDSTRVLILGRFGVRFGAAP